MFDKLYALVKQDLQKLHQISGPLAGVFQGIANFVPTEDWNNALDYVVQIIEAHKASVSVDQAPVAPDAEPVDSVVQQEVSAQQTAEVVALEQPKTPTPDQQ